MSKNRVFVIGLDGATFDLINPLVEEGSLPNIGSLLKRGCHGDLNSTIHPLTAAAWTSFMTGKNPGKHGVYDFITRVPNSYDVNLVNSHTRDRQTLWKILGNHGKKVGVINLPLNYPPEPVNGFLVSWMDAPGTNSRYTYPQELAQELKDELGEYKITVNFNTSLDNYVKELFSLVENRAKAIDHLMTTKDWDLFCALFSATDFAQHAFWKYMDKNHPQYDSVLGEKYGSVIPDIYKRIDEKLGKILSQLTPDDTVIIMSDHGFGPLKGVVNLNNWLKTNDFLTFKDGSTAATSKLIHTVVKQTKRLLPVGAKDFLKRLLPDVRDKVESKLFHSYLDWSQTKVFALGAYGNLWVNLKGREPMGIVEPGKEYDEVCQQVEDGLMQLRYKGEQVVEKVHRKEDIYTGPFLDKAPDLIIQWQDYAYHSRQRFGETEDSLFQDQQTMPMSKLEMNGFHRMNGVFIAQGKGIKEDAQITDASIMDLAPTILHILGLPIPEDMDGTILNQIFTDDSSHLSTSEKKSSESTAAAAGDEEEIYSEDEAELVKERLRSLGYLE